MQHQVGTVRRKLLAVVGCKGVDGISWTASLGALIVLHLDECELRRCDYVIVILLIGDWWVDHLHSDGCCWSIIR